MVQVKKIYRELPPNLKRFLIRGALLFIGWTILYNFLLKPIGIPDNQLTDLIVIGTGKLLSLFYSGITYNGATFHSSIVYHGASVLVNGKEAIYVEASCNGLELIVLYIGFMLCLPTSAKRFWAFTIIGTVIIYILNIIRCAVLAIMFYQHHPFTDFAHHYAFKLVVYGFIFYGWVLYSKKITVNEAV